jgi:hypothetical protein
MDPFVDRATGLSTISKLVVNDSFTVQTIEAKSINVLENITTINNCLIGNECTIGDSCDIGGNLNVGDALNVNGGINSTENVSIAAGKNLSVGGTTTTNGLTSSGNVQFTGTSTLTCAGLITASGGIQSSENVSIAAGKTLNVGGSISTVGLNSSDHVTVAAGKNLTVGATIQGSQLLQSSNFIRLGGDAGSSNQGTNAIAIGANAGQLNQGNQSIAIGNSAGVNAQPAQSIILNGSGVTLNVTNSNACYIRPIRNENIFTTGNRPLSVHPSTFEVISYAPRIQTISFEIPNDTTQRYIYIQSISNTYALSGTLILQGFGFGDVFDNGVVQYLFLGGRSATNSNAQITTTGNSLTFNGNVFGVLNVGGVMVANFGEYKIGIRRTAITGAGNFNMRATILLNGSDWNWTMAYSG